MFQEAKSEHHSLFYGIPWSQGSLGLLVAATLRIIPCQPYVKLIYQPCFSSKSMVTRLQEESTRAENEFVEAIQFTSTSSVVVGGQFVEQIPKNAAANHLARWYRPWFHTHVEEILNGEAAVRRSKRVGGEAWDENQTVVEYVPVRDYYYRHQRSWFWRMREWVPFGNQWWFR